MSVFSDINLSHRELADLWDDSRSEMEKNPDHMFRVGWRLGFVALWAFGSIASFLIPGFIAGLISGSDAVANWTGGSILAAFEILWFSIHIRSYTFKEGDAPGVDLSK